MDTRANPTQFAAAMGWQIDGWDSKIKQPKWIVLSDGVFKIPYSVQLQRDIEAAIAKGARGAGEVPHLRSAT